MLDDAIYYSRREAEERDAAKQASDLRARQIHAMLADRYGQLAKRALAGLPEHGTVDTLSRPADPLPADQRPRRFR